jgi:2-oxoglutarate ferredoxin oxidoreductase subunit alpha
VTAFHAGYSFQLENVVELFRFMEGQKRAGNQVVMNGNEALAYGLIAAGVRFGAGYPITPWSDIMELLRRELPKYGGCSSSARTKSRRSRWPLAPVTRAACRGDGFQRTGHRIEDRGHWLGGDGRGAAGGGGCAARRPLDGHADQRGAKRFEYRRFGGHGDSPRVVIAPANVEDCFYMAIEAVNIARKYSVPVILLTDQAIATRIEAFQEPNFKRSARTSRRTSAGRGSQAVRSLYAGWRHPTRGARHPHRSVASTRSSPGWSTTKWGIPRAPRSCTCR